MVSVVSDQLLACSSGHKADIEIVAVNDLGSIDSLAHLVKFDSVLGPVGESVSVDGDTIVVGERRIKVLSEREPANLPWGELNVDVVIESTGFFTNAEDAKKHVAAGAKKVIISAPAKNEDITIVMGVNQDKYDPATHAIISNAYHAPPTAWLQ